MKIKTIVSPPGFLFPTLAGVALLFSTHATLAASLKVDTQATTLSWKGTKKIGSFHEGGISVESGAVELKDGKVTSGTLTIDMKTLSNKDLAGNPDYQKKLVGHLKSADFFDVEKFPTSTFKLTSVEQQKDGKALIKGELTMIGKTGPVEFPATLNVAGDKLTAAGTITIDRTKWGLKYGSGNFFKELAGDKIINDQFEIAFNLVAKK